jgi:hypothetical protein
MAEATALQSSPEGLRVTWLGTPPAKEESAMMPFRGVVLTGVVLLGTAAAPARAAWNNVFQVCCHGCRTPSVSGYAAFSAPAADPCCPCPQPVCTTRYVQRCFYQPVTTFQTRTFYEPVTSYRTSYFYEPVCSYRYSCFFDPCTCSWKQVAQPVTSFRLRSQCNAVTSYVQRCCSVPVTSYQQVSYYEPVTTCADPCPPNPCPPNGTAAVVPGAADTRIPPQPGVEEIRGQGPGGAGQVDRYYGPGNQTAPPPPASGSSLRQPYPYQAPRLQAPAAPPRSVRPERIVSTQPSQVRGQLVSRDNRPWSGARLLFVNAEKRDGGPQAVTADQRGEFKVNLDAGRWYVYLPGQGGQPELHSKIEVRNSENRQVKLIGQ